MDSSVLPKLEFVPFLDDEKDQPTSFVECNSDSIQLRETVALTQSVNPQTEVRPPHRIERI